MRRISRNTSEVFGGEVALVLFFLSVEVGQTWVRSFAESAVLGVAFLAVVIAPNLLRTYSLKESVFNVFQGLWIGVFGVLVGLGIATTSGFPDLLRFIPMTLLIISASFMCYNSFHSLLKFRIAR